MSGVLLITGSGRGIGAATARLAGARGYRVAVNANRNMAEAEAVAASIRAAGGEARAFQADAGDEAAMAKLFAEVDAAFGPLTALVNNAGGTAGGIGSIADTDGAKLSRVFALNTFSAVYGMRFAAARMGRSKGGQGGAIVNVSSQAGTFGGNGIAAYAAAKAGVNILTVAAARELAADGIRVNAVSPGVIACGEVMDFPAERRAEMMRTLPLGRFGDPEEVARTILWLLSDEASYLTGTIVPVAGGR
jgi:NAD(P)-dependent dehydrogenase (short-subunit alcohol dehydrogenase family)